MFWSKKDDTECENVSQNTVRPIEGCCLVTLKNNEGVPIDGLENFGSYIVTVQDFDDKLNGSHATFMISGNEHYGGTVFRSSNIPGKEGENLGMKWSAHAKPELYYYRPFSSQVGTNAAETRRYKVTWRD